MVLVCSSTAEEEVLRGAQLRTADELALTVVPEALSAQETTLLG